MNFMGNNINKLLILAKSQIGTKENPANSNNIKYNTEYYGKQVSGSSYSWCCVFIWWLFKQCDLSEYFYDNKKCASCTDLMNYYKRNGKIITKDYKPGDIIFFQFDKDSYADHMGIVESSTSSTVTCIEGNTSSTSEDDGGCVMRRTRKLSLVMCGARIFEEQKENNKISIEIEELNQGNTSMYNKTLQILLNYYGYDCGKVDGIFGNNTMSAVKKFQLSNKLTQDGIVGKNTWNKLISH